MANGILVIDKSAGWTSQDVAAKLRGVFHERRVGHGGTLDPMATGVLPIFIGRATRAAEFLESAEKEYIAGLCLGVVTDTQDTSGNILETHPVTATREAVQAALAQFLGPIEQIPPMYSAVKIGGQKLYELARKGKEIERKPRSITIHELELLEGEGTEFTLRVRCSKGTYVRTLCHDLGRALGCGGCMEELLRTKVGRFSLEESHTLSEVQAAMEEGTIQDQIYPVEQVLADYPAVYADSYGDRLLLNGNPLSENLVSPQHKEGWVRMYASDGTFTGIFQWDAGKKKYYPVKMF